MAAVLVDEGLVDRAWLADHASGVDAVLAALGEVPISPLLRDQRRRRGAGARARPGGSRRPSSVAVFEDLGVQMNRHSTLVSYLEKLVWLLTGNLANPGGQYAMTEHRQHAAR